MEQYHSCNSKKRASLKALVNCVQRDEMELAKRLIQSETVETKDVKEKNEKFWLHAVILHDFMNRRVKKRLQKHCNLFQVEHSLQEFAFNIRGSSNSSENWDENGNSLPVEGANKEFDYLRYVSATPNFRCTMEVDSTTSENFEEVSMIARIETELDLERKYLRSQEDFSCLNSALKTLQRGQFVVDPVIPNLFIFHRDDRVKKSHLFRQGQFYSQDRASAMTAHVLGVIEGDVVMDACAAPGSKSSFILD